MGPSTVHLDDVAAARSNALPPALVVALRKDLRRAGFRGDIEDASAARVAVSTDNSVYRIVPDMVVAPRDSDDVAVLVTELSRQPYRRIGITARGGGTGTNAQSLNRGVIVDFRRHMHRLLATNFDEGWADVDPGLVLDELNQWISDSGWFFAPNTSTSNRCTIGGMVSTDASGKGSRIYGKTGDNILGLQVVVDGGTVLDSLAGDLTVTPMMAEIAAACDSGRGPLLARVPALARRFSGYDLERARPSADVLEWWRLFIGAEGTLGLVTRVRVRLVRKPLHSRLAVVAFASFEAALAASMTLLELEPLAIECLDEWVQSLAEKAGLLRDLPEALRSKDGTPPVYDFVEFVGDDADILDRRLDQLRLQIVDLTGVVGHYFARDRDEIARLWSVRAASVGLLSNSKSARVPVAFVEDCAVPPPNLAAFVREFGTLLRGEGLAYGIYGHADVGCLHVRPALDIGDPEDRQRLNRVSDAVFALVQRHGGIFWGEHGKGVRGQYLEEFVGPEAFAAFRRVKRALDPTEQFNPGKLVMFDAPSHGIATTPFRTVRVAAAEPLAKAYACNGNAACLSYDLLTPMCPSFKATNDVGHSPKGRAEALKEWNEVRQTVTAAKAEIESSTHALLDDCLGCNACTGACPVHVNIPDMKSRFLSDYHVTHSRPLADYAGIFLEAFAPLWQRLRPLLRLAHAVGLQTLVATALGLVDTPAASRQGLSRFGYPIVRPEQLGVRKWSPKTVLVAPDAFTGLFDTEAVAAVADGLASLGYRPVLLTLPPAGKAAHVKGDRRTFMRLARRLTAALDIVGRSGLPVVGVDPAFVLTLRQEFVGAGLIAASRVMLVQEFLKGSRLGGAQWPMAQRRSPAGKLFLHCSEVAQGLGFVRDWQWLFTELQLPVEVAVVGCCGMAGLFGHERRHQAMSHQLFDLSWRPAVESADAIMATGFSCRCQVGRSTERVAQHPMTTIARAFRP